MTGIPGRAADAWPVIAAGWGAFCAATGWWARGVRTRNLIQTRPVRAVDGTIRGWRTFYGRLSLGPLRATRSEAERHTDAIEDTL